MALIQTVISGAGPLPLKNTFTAEGDGDVVFYVAGSAWSASAGSPISIFLTLDGKPIGTISGFTNEPSSHKTLVPAFFPATLTAGQHTVGLAVQTSGTMTDYNDNFSVTLIY
ncbi:MAG TPA: hypothetical protein VF644_17845 [Pyrinomonadaceae bacterium]|jgi:hypothetical protein